EQTAVIGLKDTQAGVEQLTFGHDHDVEAWRDFVSTENLSNQSFRSVSHDGATQFSGGRDSQAAVSERIGQHEHGAVAASDASAVIIDALELGSPADPFVRAESQSLLTVRRFRPLARRRFRTSRPFLVLMRTRNPCVRLR